MEEMQSVAVSVEANLLSKRAKDRNERRIPAKEENTPFEQNMDAIVKGMDILLNRVEIIERKILIILGISAGFASVFGTPLAGAIFALEVVYFSKINFIGFVIIKTVIFCKQAICFIPFT